MQIITRKTGRRARLSFDRPGGPTCCMLYIVSTPIGNLQDISARALEVLKSVDLIAAEDTRHTAKLLAHFDIHKPLISYFEHNKIERGARLLARLQEGGNIALVTDAGTPGISDPGEHLIRLAIENGLAYTAIPGPAACINALVLSGLSTRRFLFEGFLPENKKECAERLEVLRENPVTTVFYESPHHIEATLGALAAVTGERKIVLCREMTKKFEEILRGSAAELLERFQTDPPKGEYVVVVEGAVKEREKKTADAESVACAVRDFLAKGMKRSEAIRAAADRLGIPRNEVYLRYEESLQAGEEAETGDPE